MNDALKGKDKEEFPPRSDIGEADVGNGESRRRRPRRPPDGPACDPLGLSCPGGNKRRQPAVRRQPRRRQPRRRQQGGGPGGPGGGGRRRRACCPSHPTDQTDGLTRSTTPAAAGAERSGRRRVPRTRNSPRRGGTDTPAYGRMPSMSTQSTEASTARPGSAGPAADHPSRSDWFVRGTSERDRRAAG